MFNIISSSLSLRPKPYRLLKTNPEFMAFGITLLTIELKSSKKLLSFLVCSLVECCKLADGMLPARSIFEKFHKRRLSPAFKNNCTEYINFESETSNSFESYQTETKRHDHCSLGVDSNKENDRWKKISRFCL